MGLVTMLLDLWLAHPLSMSALAVAAVVFFNRVRYVPATQMIIIERFGKVQRTFSGGFTALHPLDNIRSVTWSWKGKGRRTFNSLPTRQCEIDPPAISVMCTDHPCQIDILVRFVIQDPVKACEAHEDPLWVAWTEIEAGIRTQAQSMSFDELMTNRHVFSDNMRHKVGGALVEQYGILITEVTVQEIIIADEVAKARQDRMLARSKTRAQLERLQAECEINAMEARAERTRVEAEIDRQRLLAEAKAANERVEYSAEVGRLRALSDVGVDVSSYIAAPQYQQFTNALLGVSAGVRLPMGDGAEMILRTSE